MPGNENSKLDEEVACPWKWLKWKRMTAAQLGESGSLVDMMQCECECPYGNQEGSFFRK